ncbi:uncharacterized mitochondrial protein AtMg00310-like [Telopea speciosissima]|uniref:uncharacterized mitochondrial protein AtMg00310-like n=1 Tax=Telopea speciosissima TaxID=54955 RepID=UPI001CC4428D|nr:uncharacterized mitochondrial protein AtMg00310-like [Telopea speciosissima]
MVAPISNFAAMHFKLPSSFHNRASKEVAKVFWSGMTNSSKIHWLSWRKLCNSKSHGGLGFRYSNLQNRALLAKAAWRMCMDPDSDWAKFTKALYYLHCDFLQARIGNSPSWAWRSILEDREALKLGLLWKIGLGNKVDIWHDNWVSSLPSFKITDQAPLYPTVQKVEELIDHANQRWKKSLIRSIFSTQVTNAILCNQILLLPTEDRLVWGIAKNGIFSIKSTYHLLCNVRDTEDKTSTSLTTPNKWASTPKDVWNLIWKVGATPKIKAFLWRAGAGLSHRGRSI